MNFKSLLWTLPLSFLELVAFADGPALPSGAAPAAGGATPAVSPFANMVPFVGMFAVIYFLMIRPQQKKAKEQQAMLGALQDGDEVITTSGLLGKIAGMSEKVVTLEIADKVRVKMLKSQVSQVVKGNLKEIG